MPAPDMPTAGPAAGQQAETITRPPPSASSIRGWRCGTGALVVDAGRFRADPGGVGRRYRPRARLDREFRPAGGTRERGLVRDRDQPSRCRPGLRWPLVPGRWVGVIGSLHPAPSAPISTPRWRGAAGMTAKVPGRGHRLEASAPTLLPDWIAQLALSADGFLFSRPLPEVPDGVSVIAGYPWFGDWGRDTMIALPGLRHRPPAQPELEAADPRAPSPAWSTGACRPTCSPRHRPVCRTTTPRMPSPLWFFEGHRRAYVEATGDNGRCSPPSSWCWRRWSNGTPRRYALRHRRRSRRGRAASSPGSLRVQLTWMDAKVGDWVVTPRIGKPVEIERPLVHSALRIWPDFGGHAGTVVGPLRRTRHPGPAGFQRFVNPANGGPCDVLDGPAGDDATIRPNQILAVSLPQQPAGSGPAGRGRRGVRREGLPTSRWL